MHSNRCPASAAYRCCYAAIALSSVLALIGPEIAAAPVEGNDGGLTVEAAIAAVVQQVNAGGGEDGRRQSRISYRGDLLLTLPAGTVGDAQGTAVGQLRFGQGTGVSLRPTHTGAVNSLAFEGGAGSDNTYAVVAQAYYELVWPLDGGRRNAPSGSRIELTVGKMDLFGFFDQNEVAADEATQFLNNVFVHNPLLDSGGDIAADEYGFAPGVRVGYFTDGERIGWGASVGVFASGAAASFNGRLGQPLVIAQFEVSPKLISGETRANYRVYAWTNGGTTDLAGEPQRHTGFGLSIDHRFGRAWNLFGRYGRRTAGDGMFDSAVTLGFEHSGEAWGRGNDALGVAVGWLDTGKGWRAATADGTLTGYSAGGAERIAELYYRFKVNKHLALAPDLQIIQRAGGDTASPTIRVLGLRGRLSF